MSFFQLVFRETKASKRKLVIMSAIGGVSNAAILTAINTGAAAADETGHGSLWAATLFLVSLFLFFKTQSTIDDDHRGDRSDHSQSPYAPDGLPPLSELLAIEEMGVHGSWRQSRVICDPDPTSNMLSFSIRGVLIGFVAIYVMSLSFVAFALSLVVVGAAATILHFRSRRLRPTE